MNHFLRWVGIVNAATWLGTTLFFTFLLGPVFFSDPVLAIFGGAQNPYGARYYAGAVAQVALARYYGLQEWCGVVALVHLVVAWVYTGRPVSRWMVGLATGSLALILLGGFWLQPKLHALHRTMYGMGERVTMVQAEKARRGFGVWHGVSQTLNLLALVGIGGYFWQLNRTPAGTRFSATAKFGWE